VESGKWKVESHKMQEESGKWKATRCKMQDAIGKPKDARGNRKYVKNI
jgi:hypothetical protein